VELKIKGSHISLHSGRCRLKRLRCKTEKGDYQMIVGEGKAMRIAVRVVVINCEVKLILRLNGTFW
jgi:hypothetical protein